MKRLLFIVTIALLAVPFMVFAEDVTVNDGNPVLVDWVFEPEVSTTFGVNLDAGTIGIDSSAKISVESVIRGEANQEFGEDSGTYGTITVEDLEIKFATGDLFDNNSRENETVQVAVYDDDGNLEEDDDGNVVTKTVLSNEASVLRASVGDIIGTIHFGPVYLRLNDTGGDLGKVGGLDADYSVINTDLVSPYSSGGLSNRTYKDLEASYDADGTGNPGFVDDIRNAGAVLGFKNDTIDFNLQVAQQYGVRDYFPLNADNERVANSTIFGLGLDLTFDALEIGLGGYTTAGLVLSDSDGNGLKDQREAGKPDEFWSTFFAKGSASALWLSLGYGIPVAGLTIKPVLGFDVLFTPVEAFNYKDAVDPTAAEVEDYAALEYEVAAAVKVLWDDRDGALSGDEDNYLGFLEGDEEVTDGISLGVLYGSDNSASDSVSAAFTYLGAKVAAYHSPGTIVPNLELGAMINFNYGLGITDNDANFAVNAFDASFIKNLSGGGGADLGTGFEATYGLPAVNVTLGLSYILKNLVANEIKGELFDGTEVTFKDASEDDPNNDLRLGLGLEFPSLIKNTSISLDYFSGDLVNDDYVDGGGSIYASESSSEATELKYGLIELEFKVSF